MIDTDGLTIQRNSIKTYVNYGDRFSAALTKLIDHGDLVYIPVTLAAWPLIHNDTFDPSQNLRVMPTAVSSAASSKLSRRSGKNSFLSAISYEPAASVV